MAKRLPTSLKRHVKFFHHTFQQIRSKSPVTGGCVRAGLPHDNSWCAIEAANVWFVGGGCTIYFLCPYHPFSKFSLYNFYRIIPFFNNCLRHIRCLHRPRWQPGKLPKPTRRSVNVIRLPAVLQGLLPCTMAAGAINGPTRTSALAHPVENTPTPLLKNPTGNIQ